MTKETRTPSSASAHVYQRCLIATCHSSVLSDDDTTTAPCSRLAGLEPRPFNDWFPVAQRLAAPSRWMRGHGTMSQLCRHFLLPSVLLSLLSLSPAVPGGAVDTSSDGGEEERRIPSAHSQPCETPSAVSSEVCLWTSLCLAVCPLWAVLWHV